MEIRNGKVIVSGAGGTAGRNAKTYKLSLPTSWLERMGINADRKEIQLCFDGNLITIKKRLSVYEFIQEKKAQHHDLKWLSYFNQSTLCTQICADFSDHTLAIENESVPNLYRAFGVNETPTWNDFMVFLEERCVPQQRDGLNYYLDALGLDEYDPWEIVQRTEGRMAEDHQWLKLEELK